VPRSGWLGAVAAIEVDGEPEQGQDSHVGQDDLTVLPPVYPLKAPVPEWKEKRHLPPALTMQQDIQADVDRPSKGGKDERTIERPQ